MADWQVTAQDDGVHFDGVEHDPEMVYTFMLMGDVNRSIDPLFSHIRPDGLPTFPWPFVWRYDDTRFNGRPFGAPRPPFDYRIGISNYSPQVRNQHPDYVEDITEGRVE